MKSGLPIAVLCCALCLALSTGPARADALTSSDLKPALEKMLRENPEVVLDFLREHSETLLDIVQQGSDQRRLANMEKQWAQDVKEPKKVNTSNRPRVGSPDAKVTIISFSDFTCAYCLRAEKTIEEILRQYREKVSFVFKNMPLERNGLGGLASHYFIALSMQSDMLAWTFYREMFHNRDKLLDKGEEFMREVCQKIGADMKKLDSARRGKQVAAIFNEDMKEADDLRIEGTPYFLVNDLVIRGAAAKEIFERAIEIELERAGK